MGNLSSGGLGSHRDLFRLLVNSVEDYAIFVLDPTGHVISWNPGARRIKGYSPSEIIGNSFSVFYTPEDRESGKPQRALRTAAEQGRWIDEGWRVRKDGTRFWASVVLTALYQDGDLVGFAKVTRDLTERMRVESERIQLLDNERAARAETELALSRLRAIQRVTDAALAHVDLDELLEDLLNQVMDLLSVDSVVFLLADENGVLSPRATRGPSLMANEVAVERVDDPAGGAGLITVSERAVLSVPLVVAGREIGELRVGSIEPREFDSNDTHFLRIIADRVALAIDHARLIQAETRARRDADVAAETLRAREEFLTVAAHELKTPITSLQLATEILLRDVGDGIVNKPLRVIQVQTQRLTRVVNQILESSRHRSGDLQLHPVPTNLALLVSTVVRDARMRGDHFQIDLFSADRVVAAVDASRLEPVFAHLLDNAIKFSPDGGPIEVRLDQLDAMIVFSVRDHGLGIPAEHRPHLFERFYQAHAADYRSGIGLGLYICKEIVELHGGTIRAEFPDDGGTRIVVTLPA